jgi:hypothetical protein
MRRMVRKLFRGSPELMMTQLVTERALTREQMRRMKALLDARLKEERQR